MAATTEGQARRLMARLDALAAYHRRPAQTDAALPVAVAPARRRAVHRLGRGGRAVGAHRSGRQRPRALRGPAAERAGADDRLAYRHGARRRPLRRRARRARRAERRRGPRRARAAARRRDRDRRLRRRGRRALSPHPDRLARPRRGQRAGDAGAEGRRRRVDARRARRRSAATPTISARRAPKAWRRSSNCISSRGRCWRPRAGRSASSARSTARRGSAPS